MSFVKAAKTGEILPGTMNHVEIKKKELCIANVGGKFYAIGDRCGHENASLARGKLEGTLVICPMHSSKFDGTTGKKSGRTRSRAGRDCQEVQRVSRTREKRDGRTV